MLQVQAHVTVETSALVDRVRFVQGQSGAGGGAAGAQEDSDDDDVPDLVETFDEGS